jgi:hypothetical protein
MISFSLNSGLDSMKPYTKFNMGIWEGSEILRTAVVNQEKEEAMVCHLVTQVMAVL